MVVTGQVFSDLGQSDFTTVKYQGSDGSVSWGPFFFHGAFNADDSPLRIAIDTAGGVVVTGTSIGASALPEVTTIKYDGATGAMLWGPTILSTGGGEEFAGLVTSGTTVLVGANSLGHRVLGAFDDALGVVSLSEQLPVAHCGQAYGPLLQAANGTPPFAWSVVSGALPNGLGLTADGLILGTPMEEGEFTFRVQVQDAALATATRDLKIRVADSGGIVPITVSAGPGCLTTLSIGGSFSSYLWLPGGETTPTIGVLPGEPTTYAVVCTDETGCLTHGAVTLAGPGCSAPLTLSIQPTSGAPAGGTAVAVSGAHFDPGASLTIGGISASGIVISPEEIDGVTPPLEAGLVYDVRVANPKGLASILPKAFLADFNDVPPSDPFHEDIVRIAIAGITAGCEGGNYCPMAPITRAQMAVFLLKALLGSSFVPPVPIGQVFEDVPPGSFASDWIRQLFEFGITTGCSIDPPLYCPDAPVTRAEMAVFLLKTRYGAAHVPPMCTGVFDDVPCPNG